MKENSLVKISFPFLESGLEEITAHTACGDFARVNRAGGLLLDLALRLRGARS